MKRGIKILLIVLLFLFILLLVAFLYFNSQKEKIVKDAIEKNIELYEVSTDIDKITYSFNSSLKDLNLGIKGFQLETYDTLMNKKQKVYLGDCEAQISLKHLLKRGIKIKKIEVDSASLYSHIEAGKPVQFYVDHTVISDKNTMIPLYEKLHEQGAEISVKEFDLEILDDVKNKRYHAIVHDLTGTITPQEEEHIYHSDFHMDAWIDQLGFNLAKGTFGNQIDLENNMHGVINAEKQTIQIKEHPLTIGEQVFQTTMDFFVNDGMNYKFVFKNDKTDFAATRKILSDSIQVKLAALEIEKPLSASCSLEGKFTYKNNPVVNAKFSMLDNEISLLEKYKIHCNNLEGGLINRQQNYSPGEVVDLADMFVHVEDFKGSYNQLPFELTKTIFEITQKGYGIVKVNIDANGKVSQVTDLLHNLPVKIAGGAFDIDQYVQARMSAGKWALEDFDGLLDIKGTRLGLPNFRDDIVIHDLSGHLHNENAKLNHLELTFAKQDISVSGEVNHYENLLNNSGKGAYTNIKVSSPWLSLVELQKEIISLGEPKNKKGFDPRLLSVIAPQSQFTLNVKEFETFGPTLKNIDADVVIVSPEELDLARAVFDVDKINTSAKGKLLLDEGGVFIDFNVNSGGPFIQNPQIFENSTWKLENGRFDFDGRVTGDITNMKQLIEQAQGNLKLSKADFISKGINLPLQLVDLDAEVHNNTAEIKNLDLAFISGNEVKINTKVDDISHLLEKGLPLKTTLSVESESINIADFLFINKKEKVKKHLTLEEQKQVVWAAFHTLKRYQPRLNVRLDEFVNGTNTFNNIITDIGFGNPNTLHLDQFSAEYQNSRLETVGSISLLNANDQDSTFQSVNSQIQLFATGNTKDYNDIFKDQDFSFTQGNYEIQAVIDGDMSSFDDFANIAQLELLIVDDKIKQINSPIELGLDSLLLFVDGKKSELTVLKIPVSEQEHIKMSGEIVDFLTLFDTDSTKNPSTRLNVYSENLNVSEFVKNFEIYMHDIAPNEKPDTTKKKSGLKDVLLTIFRKYDPSLEVKIDKASYRKVEVDSVIAMVDLTKDKVLEISRAGFQFPGGFVETKANVDIGKTDRTPFDINFLADNVDIEELIADSKLVGLPEMNLGGELMGHLFLDIKVDGEFDQYDNLQTEDLNGHIGLKLDSLRMKDFSAIIDNMKVLPKERFEDIQYAPIDIELKFQNGEYDLERTEIQASAYQVFLEGIYKEEGFAELWLSVPLRNLKKRDFEQAPEKTGYYLSGKKVYLVYKVEQGKEPKLKFLLSNKRLYKDKGEMDEYRKERKKGRKIRKDHRREMRRERRESKKKIAS